ncbi:hypothetical protein SAMN06269250_1771 [Spirosoma fluviale]|uniref:Uncharacterized protein n=1 Tax=Spirosoma fluviale TaxID=1597977 RepID=A0A286FDS1_9BACT|nr:hypothetical protein SAMN06269250_1771 [Spirosoma fluviale]
MNGKLSLLFGLLLYQQTGLAERFQLAHVSIAPH